MSRQTFRNRRGFVKPSLNRIKIFTIACNIEKGSNEDELKGSRLDLIDLRAPNKVNYGKFLTFKFGGVLRIYPT